jgi:hypothetical protein
MARDFGGDATRMRAHARRALERSLGVVISSWSSLQKEAFDNFALVLSLVTQLNTWTREEKKSLVQVIRAKSAADEMLYLHLTQGHEALREALIEAGLVV